MVPFIRPLFKAEPVLAGNWLLVAVLVLIPVTVIELAKLVRAWLRASRIGSSNNAIPP